MIPLSLSASSDFEHPFVTRLGDGSSSRPGTSRLQLAHPSRSLWVGEHGLLEVDHGSEDVSGDVVLVMPAQRRVERLIRSGSKHNTLLVTEQCDQLCIMCSQPPKKSHTDRFRFFEEACLLADPEQTIGLSGGEPTLHMEPLLALIERVGTLRPDLQFHVLTNAQHFEQAHTDRLRQPVFERVVWGIPLYSDAPEMHDRIVGKSRAFDRLQESLVQLLRAGARIELRTVLMSENADRLAPLARFVAENIPSIEQWSIMDLENIGFARKGFAELRFDILHDFGKVAKALDLATVFGLSVRLFNLPLCFVPEAYRHYAVASISDWKQRFGAACSVCSEKPNCSGFFEWQPEQLLEEVTPL